MALFSLLFSSIVSYESISFLLALFIVYTCYFYLSYFTRKNPLPGPLPLPFVGNLVDKGFHNFVEYAEKMREKYGDTFEMYFGSTRFIMLSKYEHIHQMFDSSLKSKYTRHIPYFAGLEELGIAGKGVALNHDVNAWKYNRNFFSRALLTSAFTKNSVIWTQNLVEEMMKFWKDASDDNGCLETDIVEWARRFTTDSTTLFTTGSRVHSMEAYYYELMALHKKKLKTRSYNNTTDATRFVNSIETFVEGVYFFMVVPPWIRKCLPFLSTASKHYLENRDWLFNNIDKLIKTRRKEIEYTPRNQPLKMDMLTCMLTTNTDRDICGIKPIDKEHARHMTNEEVCGVLWEAYVAGIDATANLFTFIVYYLAKYPDVLKRLCDELDAFFEKLGDSRLDIENLSDLVYTEAVIKEVARIFAPAPYTARNSTAEDILEGRVWPEGTQYMINIQALNLNEEYWDKPKQFNPDRWLDDTENEKLMPFVAFGGGRRVCPGRKLAFIQLKSKIALIYHKFDIALIDKNAPVKTKFVLMRSFHDLFVQIKPRQVL